MTQINHSLILNKTHGGLIVSLRKIIVMLDVFCGAMVTVSTRGTMYTTGCVSDNAEPLDAPLPLKLPAMVGGSIRIRFATRNVSK